MGNRGSLSWLLLLPSGFLANPFKFLQKGLMDLEANFTKVQNISPHDVVFEPRPIWVCFVWADQTTCHIIFSGQPKELLEVHRLTARAGQALRKVERSRSCSRERKE
ncbi:hypothetical protein STEG23_021431, partial [Scotinomys teguina]